jgi:capsular polysaccharide biosynthesis protein
MDTFERTTSNGPGTAPPVSSPFQGPTSAYSRDRMRAAAHRIKSPGLLRRLAHRWWQILLLSFVAFLPVMTLVFYSIQPTYLASSLLRVDPAAPELFSPLKESISDGRSLTYLQTQANLITSMHVLNSAVADPLVVNLPMIKQAENPVDELKKKLIVDIREDTSLIRVALESQDPNEAITIVDAVVGSYMSYNRSYSRGANKELTDSLTKQLENLRRVLENKRATLRELTKRDDVVVLKRSVDPGNPDNELDPAQPSLSALTPEQFNKLGESLIQCDLEYLEAVAQLEAVKSAREQNKEAMDRQLEARIAEEFQEEPNVAALIDQTELSRDRLNKAIAADQPADKPAVLAAQREIADLEKKYRALWAESYGRIRRQLIDLDQGPLSETRLRELEAAIDKAKKKKIAYAEYAAAMKAADKSGIGSPIDANSLEFEIRKLQSREDQVERNLVQLNFEATQDKFRIVLVDPASAPKNPDNDKRVKYLAAAPPFVFFLIFGLFLVHEINAGRAAARARFRDFEWIEE